MAWRWAKKTVSGLVAGGMWILAFPVAVEEGVAVWKRWLGITDDQSMEDAMNILYQHFGPSSIFIAIAASLVWWFYWYPPQWLRRRFAKYRAGSAASVEDISAHAPVTWTSRSAALTIIGKSSLVRLRVNSDTTLLDTLARHLGDTYKTPGEVRAAELQRKLLRDFEAQHPNGVSDGKYGRELLDWWIDEQAFRTDT